MFRRLVLKLFFRLLKPESRRMVLLSSLLPTFTSKAVDETTLKNVNEALGLANDIRALHLPIELSKDIWDKETIDLIEKITKEEHDHKTLVDLIYSHTPTWLKYNYSDLNRDIAVLDSMAKHTNMA